MNPRISDALGKTQRNIKSESHTDLRLPHRAAEPPSTKTIFVLYKSSAAGQEHCANAVRDKGLASL